MGDGVPAGSRENHPEAYRHTSVQGSVVPKEPTGPHVTQALLRRNTEQMSADPSRILVSLPSTGGGGKAVTFL